MCSIHDQHVYIKDFEFEIKMCMLHRSLYGYHIGFFLVEIRWGGIWCLCALT